MNENRRIGVDRGAGYFINALRELPDVVKPTAELLLSCLILR